MKKRFTGMLDRYCNRIFEGDTIRAGMRRDDTAGWTTEKVVCIQPRWKRFICKPAWNEWVLVGSHGEAMDMQMDQQLREVVQGCAVEAPK